MTDVTRLLDPIATARDDTARARHLRGAARALLDDPDAAEGILAAALGEADPRTQAAQALLSTALDEARMAQENGLPEGAALIRAVTSAMEAHDVKTPLEPDERLMLARIFASAELVPPPVAMLAPVGLADVDAGDAPDIEDLVGPVLRDLGDAPGQAFAALSETLAGLPTEMAAMIVGLVVARPGATEARLGLSWLLDPRAELRLAAATALLSRAEAGTLRADAAALLPTIRKWLPEEAARTALDATIRRQMRGGAVPAPHSAKVHRAASSLPDGAGAQSLMAAVQVGGRRFVAMAMLKQGHGVKDAFLLPCASATEQKRLMARVTEEIEAHDLPPEAIGRLLALGLGDGLAQGVLPAPGIVDMLDIWGPEALTPVAPTARDILLLLDAPATLDALPQAHHRALLQASADWLEALEHMDSWFEDTGPLRAAILRARTETGRETAIWKHLETRRDWWARVIALSAQVLQAAGNPLWLSCAAVAQALLDGVSLKRVPVMAEIVELSLEAWEYRQGGARGRGRGGQPDPWILLARAGISAARLDGYLVALAISPRAPSPQAWLGGLLGGIDFPGDGVIDLLLETVTQRADWIDNVAGNAREMTAMVAALDADGFRDWAAGFEALVGAAKRAWPAKALAADDKRVLRAIAAVAEGQDDVALRAILPDWIARRHTLRD